MDKKETINLFLKNGFQLSQDALPIVQKKPKETLIHIKKINPRPFIVTKKHLEQLEEETDVSGRFELIDKFSTKKGRLQVWDYTKNFAGVYDKIKKIIIDNNKLDKLISVNKITTRTQEFSLIVSIRDIHQNNLLIEDMTGETHIFFDTNLKSIGRVEKDDILALECKREKDKVFIEKVIFPSVPITREIKKTNLKIKIIYLYRSSMLDDKKKERLISILKKTKKKNPIVIYGKWQDKEVLDSFTNVFLIEEGFPPSIFNIGGVNVLMFYGNNKPEDIIDKRLIKPENNIFVFPIDNAPDIIFFSNEKTYYKNYKGTTIISNNNKEKYFVVDLNSREVLEKEL